MLTCLCHGRAFERVADTLVDHADERAGVCSSLPSGIPYMRHCSSLTSLTPLLWVRSERARMNAACFFGRVRVSAYKYCVHAHERAEATFFDRANFVFIPCRAR